MLAVQMGIVEQNLKWQDTIAGVPQGAILSPLLANLYLNGLDKFVRTLRVGYVRYADDFVVLCTDFEEVDRVLDKITAFLRDNLHLQLNKPVTKSTKEGIEFLGIFIREKDLSITSQKQADLKSRIDTLELTTKGIKTKDLQSLEGIRRYYAQIVAQDYLRELDDYLFEKLKTWVRKHFKEIKNKTVLINLLHGIPFQSMEYQLYKSRVLFDVTEIYVQLKNLEKGEQTNLQNKELIRQRKKEYHKRERANKELLVNTYGCFLGLTSKGITVKRQGKIIYQQPVGALTHITVSSKGVTLSSNLIDYCLAHRITIDFSILQAGIQAPSFRTSIWKARYGTNRLHAVWRKEIRLPQLLFWENCATSWHWSSIFISITKGIILSLMRNSRRSWNSLKGFKSL